MTERKAKFLRHREKTRQQRRREFFCKLGNGALGGAVGVTGCRPIGIFYHISLKNIKI